MYTIFKNDTSIILTDNRNILKEKNHFAWSDINQADTLYSLLERPNSSICIYDENLAKMWQEFSQHFKIIEAAGGLVNNNKAQILFIFRNGVWDLPKGKIEVGESREEAGIREVQEECGITSLELGDSLGATYHLYDEKGIEVLKISHWFRMLSNQQELTPQLEEGITALKWIGTDELEEIRNNTYPNILRLLELYLSASQ